MLQASYELNEEVVNMLAAGVAPHWRKRRAAHGTRAFDGLRVSAHL